MKFRKSRQVRPVMEPLDRRALPSTIGHAHLHAHAHTFASVAAHTNVAATPAPVLAPGTYLSNSGTITSSIYSGFSYQSSLTLIVGTDFSLKGSLSVTLSYTPAGSTTPVFTSTDTFALNGHIAATRGTVFLGGSGGFHGSFLIIGSASSNTLNGHYFFIGDSSTLPDVGAVSFPLSLTSTGSAT